MKCDLPIDDDKKSSALVDQVKALSPTGNQQQRSFMTRTTLYLPDAGRSPDVKKVKQNEQEIWYKSKDKGVLAVEDECLDTPAVDKSGQVMYMRDMIQKPDSLANSTKKAANLSRLENETKHDDKVMPTRNITDETKQGSSKRFSLKYSSPHFEDEEMVKSNGPVSSKNESSGIWNKELVETQRLDR